MNTIKITFITILILNTFITNAQTIFTHTANATNIEGNQTNIDNSIISEAENKLLFVTQVFSDYYNNHSFGVQFLDGKWTIKQEDEIQIPVGSIYNILAVNPSETAFVHQVDESNSSNNWTIINHPTCNENPDAILLITQRYQEAENPKSIGVRYELGKWRIFNQDRSTMPIDAKFNVLILTKKLTQTVDGNAFVFEASEATTNEYFTHLSNLPLKGHDAKIFVTQNASKGIYNNHETAVWNSGPIWTVYNKDQTNLPENALFNMLVIGGKEISNMQTEKENKQRAVAMKSVSLSKGYIRFFNESDYVAGGVISYIYKGELQKITTRRLAANDSATIEIPEGVSDIKLTLQLNDILWVKIEEIDFGANAPNDCYTFLGTMTNATFTNDCDSKP